MIPVLSQSLLDMLTTFDILGSTLWRHWCILGLDFCVRDWYQGSTIVLERTKDGKKKGYRKEQIKAMIEDEI